MQLTIPLLLRTSCNLFASVARVCQRQLGFLVEFPIAYAREVRADLR